MNKDKYKNRTDQAWHRLHARFEAEGLLENAAERKSPRTMVRWAVVAAVVILAVMVTIPYYLKTNNVTPPLISQSNNIIGSSLVKTLDDGSIVYLTSSATVKYPSRFEKGERKVALRGEALFDIAHDVHRPFFIDTDDATIQVLGTCFNVKNIQGKPFELGVYRGAVQVTDKRLGTVTVVKRGQTVKLVNGRMLLSNTPPQDSLGRYVNNIRFKDETLENILKVINANNIGFHLQTTTNAACRKLTVAFAADTPPVMAELLCQALHLKMETYGHVITLK